MDPEARMVIREEMRILKYVDVEDEDDYIQTQDESRQATVMGTLLLGRACPDCGNSLVWSDYNGGEYVRGWMCNNVDTCGSRAYTAGSFRWYCQRCNNDFCDKCLGAPAQPQENISRSVNRKSTIGGYTQGCTVS